MNQYKEDANEVVKLIRAFLKPTIIVIILGFILQGAGIISMNIRRETVQHSQQYVETKISHMNKLMIDYYTLETEIKDLKNNDGDSEIISGKVAQQKNILNQVKHNASLIPDNQIPENVLNFILSYERIK